MGIYPQSFRYLSMIARIVQGGNFTAMPTLTYHTTPLQRLIKVCRPYTGLSDGAVLFGFSHFLSGEQLEGSATLGEDFFLLHLTPTNVASGATRSSHASCIAQRPFPQDLPLAFDITSTWVKHLSRSCFGLWYKIKFSLTLYIYIILNFFCLSKKIFQV